MHISTTNTCTYVYVAACLQLSLPPSPLPPPSHTRIVCPNVCMPVCHASLASTAIYPPLRRHQNKWPVFKRAYRRNNERSCVLFFTILLEYQFFTEILKQVRGSVKIHSLNDGPFYFGGSPAKNPYKIYARSFRQIYIVL